MSSRTNDTASAIIGILWVIQWIAGILLAKGFWSTFFAVITVGLWSLVLVIERVLMQVGWLP